jgi:acid phosphatase type 7
MTRVAAALIRVVCLVLVKSLLAASKLAFAVVNRRCPGYLDHAALGRSCTGSFCGDLLVGAVAHSWRLLVQGLTSLVFMCVHRADEYVRPPPSPVVLVKHDRPASHPQQVRCGPLILQGIFQSVGFA